MCHVSNPQTVKSTLSCYLLIFSIKKCIYPLCYIPTFSLKITILLIKHFRCMFAYIIRSLLLFLMLFPVICHLFQKFLHSFVLFLLFRAFSVLFSHLVNNKLWNLDKYRASMNNYIIFLPKFSKWSDYQVELKNSVSFQ